MAPDGTTISDREVTQMTRARLRNHGILGLTLALGLVPGALTSISAARAADPVALKVVDYWGDEPAKTYWRELYTNCGKEVGATVSVESVPGNDLVPKVLQMMASKTLPDVLMFDNPDMQQVAVAGALTPLSDYGVDTKGFYPGILSARSYDGKVYGLAPAVDMIGLFYNKDILDKAGVTPPKTWDELKAAAKKLTTADRYGFAFDADPGLESAWQFLPFMWSNGGNETKLNDPKVVEALQLWVDLVKSGSVSESVVTWTQHDLNDQFVAGKAAMMINGPWQFPKLEKVAGLHYGVVDIPVPHAGDASVAPLGGEVYTVPKTGDAEKQKKAAALIACMNTDEKELALAAKRQTVPSKVAIADKYSTDVPKMAPFVKIVANARARTGLLGPSWPKAASAISNAIQSALTGQATPQQALDAAQASMAAK
jgi:multiple sugar transport system substrate-binding protein